MTFSREQLTEMLDAYLDGRLNAEQARQFEALAKADPLLAADWEEARAAEARLKRLFEPPAVGELTPQALQPPAPLRFPVEPETVRSPGLPAESAPPAEHANPSAPSPTPRRPWYYAVAAAVLLAGGAIYMNLNSGGPTTPAVAKQALTPAQLYANLMKKRFKPAFVCENDEQFAKFLGDRFGAGAVLAQAANTEVLGWDYADGMLGEATAVIMAKVQEREVVLVVDQRRYDHPLPEPGGELHLFRSICNTLVFYEITPFAEPRLLPRVRAADPLVLQTD